MSAGVVGGRLALVVVGGRLACGWVAALVVACGCPGAAGSSHVVLVDAGVDPVALWVLALALVVALALAVALTLAGLAAGAFTSVGSGLFRFFLGRDGERLFWFFFAFR